MYIIRDYIPSLPCICPTSEQKLVVSLDRNILLPILLSSHWMRVKYDSRSCLGHIGHRNGNYMLGMAEMPPQFWRIYFGVVT